MRPCCSWLPLGEETEGWCVCTLRTVCMPTSALQQCMARFWFAHCRYRDIWRYSRLFVWKDELGREW